MWPALVTRELIVRGCKKVEPLPMNKRVPAFEAILLDLGLLGRALRHVSLLDSPGRIYPKITGRDR